MCISLQTRTIYTFAFTYQGLGDLVVANVDMHYPILVEHMVLEVH